MESIDALAIAVNNYSGGLVLVSHDMRLISQVAKEIWICDKKKIEKYKGDIMNFKMDLRKAQGIGSDGAVKLKGDASVKASAKAKKLTAKKAVSKLSVIQPPKVSEPTIATIREEPPIATPPEEKVITSDVSSKPVATVVTSPSESTSAPVEGAPAKKYIPIHLRKKMAAEAAKKMEAEAAGN
jgi:ATP-binding cassette subfamily F protein 2